MAENFNDDQVAPVALLLWDGTKWTRFTTTTTIPVSLSGVATEATLASILTELGAKLEEGGNVVITGTITANAGTNLNTSTLATQATLASLLTELQAKADLVETQPVSIAGTVATDPTDDPTRDLGKVDVASLDQYTPVSGRLPVDPSGVTSPVSAASLPLPSGAATSALQGTYFGKTITYVSVAQGAAGTTALAGASASNKHKLVGACLVGDAAGTVSFTDGTVTLCGAMSIAANAGFVLPTGILPYTETAAVNRPLNLVTATAKVSGMVAILTEP